MRAHLDALASNVRALREAHGLSLSQLSDRSGVGKATLFKIEQARTNPTLETLLLIADTFDVPVAELVARRTRASIEVVREGEGDELVDDSSRGHGIRKQVVGAGVMSIDSARFHAGTCMLAQSHGVGAREHVLVRNGSIEIGPAGEEVILHAGDYATFVADRPHRWRPVDGDATVWIIGTFPRPAAFVEQGPDGL
ncbi:helix-turn-helix domain-containing protein [Modestobacter sp. VKM Ac-2978]|uniref:helix-turn-helix domain-containing protein n=1 Tax=Modestobacter sp. VKM Ac-2978 TaxID=3004132 RepID=UPI0022AA207C|nr:XRE family transcriptional regulator [Modestobacter sp. VKM Ac-2978]MCZ2849916.1 XRE family transcriptional regulator [Modestobacter sp. VKM Ac-2978]